MKTYCGKPVGYYVSRRRELPPLNFNYEFYVSEYGTTEKARLAAHEAIQQYVDMMTLPIHYDSSSHQWHFNEWKDANDYGGVPWDVPIYVSIIPSTFEWLDSVVEDVIEQAKEAYEVLMLYVESKEGEMSIEEKELKKRLNEICQDTLTELARKVCQNYDLPHLWS